MALTNNNLEMVKAIANNDIHAARLAAMASLAEDQTKKNETVVNRYKQLLAGRGGAIMTALPRDLQTTLVGSMPGNFDPERYYLRSRDEWVVAEVVKMKKIASALAERRIPYRNSTLLYGESGTGKTELARYIAHKLNLPFFFISFAGAIDSHLGSTAKNIKKVFEYVHAIPCVFMIDEIDCIAVRRASAGSHGADGELERTTISIMQELDALPNHVVLIAATNRLDIVDPALHRRFSIKHEMVEMTNDEMWSMIDRFAEATQTKQFLDPEQIRDIMRQGRKPGDIMPALIRAIGNAMYEQNKEKFDAEDVAEPVNTGVWDVSYIWTVRIPAETEEDAIAIAQKARLSFGPYSNSGESRYEAKQAEFLPPPEQK